MFQKSDPTDSFFKHEVIIYHTGPNFQTLKIATHLKTLRKLRIFKKSKK